MNVTSINWTNMTWNPVSGCEKVSEGCKHCYAETIAEKFRGKAFPNGFELTLRPHKLREPCRLRTPSLVFVNSMSDLFWERIPDDYRDRILDVIEETPHHEYQVLTKRPEVMRAYAKRRKLPPNFWAGVTIESNRHVDRADILRDVDAEIRFISAEPLLSALPDLDLTGMQWVITGGESGAHLMEPEVCARRALVEHRAGRWHLRDDRLPWLREIRDTCRAAGVAYWHKQHGGPHPESAGRTFDGQTYDALPRYPHREADTAMTMLPVERAAVVEAMLQ